jgi:hypothetical protein
VLHDNPIGAECAVVNTELSAPLIEEIVYALAQTRVNTLRFIDNTSALAPPASLAGPRFRRRHARRAIFTPDALPYPRPQVLWRHGAEATDGLFSAVEWNAGA